MHFYAPVEQEGRPLILWDLSSVEGNHLMPELEYNNRTSPSRALMRKCVTSKSSKELQIEVRLKIQTALQSTLLLSWNQCTNIIQQPAYGCLGGWKNSLSVLAEDFKTISEV